MKSFTSVLVAGFAALAQAVQLTNSNFNVEAGKPFTITWSDAQGPVTLTLKNGPSTNLVTVQSIATGQSGTSFTWTPSSTLPSDQYAIEISDTSGGPPNYSAQFSLATDVTASASVSATATTAASGTTTAAPSTMTSAASSSSASAESSSAASSAANSSSTLSTSTHASSTHASTRTSATSGSTTAPTTVPGSDSVRLGSPIALIGLTVAAMLYFQ
ncbi:Ser-Thr-rich glycosyl-phosphatidyl-inositol-anchored membrane family-domain-containing protein [Colletotrichum cereale]|nr:Ser-Thr-rich glycosyl-phosphatidyl-inositol-anchored membrane family-domain-containing protein [Colletotrichum cereale]